MIPSASSRLISLGSLAIFLGHQRGAVLMSGSLVAPLVNAMKPDALPLLGQISLNAASASLWQQ